MLLKIVVCAIPTTITIIFDNMIELKHNISKSLYSIAFLLISSSILSQSEKSSIWQNFKQSLSYAKEDISFGVGVNTSGIYISKYRRDTKMGLGTQIFSGIYLPYSDNMFFHAQLGISYQQYQHRALNNLIHVDLFFLELPLFISAQLPISNTVETRFLLGWQSNLTLGSNQKGAYPENWASDGSGIEYTSGNMMRTDFGLYFGLGAEYKRWMFRFSGFTGIRKIVESDTGMINTFKLEIGFFPFRKL
jgi:hypothetical protein